VIEQLPPEAAGSAALFKRAIDAETVLDRREIRMPIFPRSALLRASR
jgi:hypothetical protein